jgi:hypothetical protein
MTNIWLAVFVTAPTNSESLAFYVPNTLSVHNHLEPS